MEEDNLILVDMEDNQVGTGKKLDVHRKGLLHRAFSIFIFNSKGEMLIQQRAFGKYHSGGLWSNSCCSHPRNNENIENAVHRRLKEEMGFDSELAEAFTFHYKVEFDNGFTENEFLHVFIGQYDGKVTANKDEADDFKWVSVNDLFRDVRKNPENYTYWFKKCFERVIDAYKEKILIN